MSRIPVWIDCDTGVDDSAAILTAGQLSAIEIRGISTVAGNVPLANTVKNTLKICELMGREIPVYAGAAKPLRVPYIDASYFHGTDGLGGAVLPEPTHKARELKAWEALYQEAVKQKGNLNLIAIGPLTNVATALTLYPDLKDYLEKILIMGGAASGGNITACAEFNVYADPDAAQTVFRSGVPIVMFGLDVTEKAYVTAEEIVELSKHGSAVTDYIYDSTYSRTEYYAANHIPGACQHDTCPVMYLQHPELFTLEEAGVFVETQSELTRGKTVTDLFSDRQFEEKNAMVALAVDRDAFVSYMFEALKAY